MKWILQERLWLMLQDITQDDVDDLVDSMLNYYLLVQCGIIKDKDVGPQFLKAIKELSKNGVSILET